MRFAVIIAAMLVVTAALAKSAIAGTFGLEKGMTLDHLRSIDPNMLAIDNPDGSHRQTGVYEMQVVPKPHKSFAKYRVRICPKSGLSRVRAIGREIRTDGTGTELRAQFGMVRQRLEKKYGTVQIIDEPVPESVYRTPDDWDKDVISYHRFLSATWTKGTGATLPRDYAKIYVCPAVKRTELGSVTVLYGSITLLYEFANEGPECPMESGNQPSTSKSKESESMASPSR